MAAIGEGVTPLQPAKRDRKMEKWLLKDSAKECGEKDATNADGEPLRHVNRTHSAVWNEVQSRYSLTIAVLPLYHQHYGTVAGTTSSFLKFLSFDVDVSRTDM